MANIILSDNDTTDSQQIVHSVIASGDKTFARNSFPVTTPSLGVGAAPKRLVRSIRKSRYFSEGDRSESELVYCWTDDFNDVMPPNGDTADSEVADMLSERVSHNGTIRVNEMQDYSSAINLLLNDPDQQPVYVDVTGEIEVIDPMDGWQSYLVQENEYRLIAIDFLYDTQSKRVKGYYYMQDEHGSLARRLLQENGAMFRR